MKKLLMMALSLVMMITLVACSSPSKKYDEDINKILQEEKLNRNEVNITVYEADFVNVDSQIDGKKNIYKIVHSKNETDVYFFDNKGELEQVNGGGPIVRLIVESMKNKVYEEINDKNLKDEEFED